MLARRASTSAASFPGALVWSHAALCVDGFGVILIAELRRLVG